MFNDNRTMDISRKEMENTNDSRAAGLLHQEFRVFDLSYKCTWSVVFMTSQVIWWSYMKAFSFDFWATMLPYEGARSYCSSRTVCSLRSKAIYYLGNWEGITRASTKTGCVAIINTIYQISHDFTLLFHCIIFSQSLMSLTYHIPLIVLLSEG